MIFKTIHTNTYIIKPWMQQNKMNTTVCRIRGTACGGRKPIHIFPHEFTNLPAHKKCNFTFTRHASTEAIVLGKFALGNNMNNIRYYYFSQ